MNLVQVLHTQRKRNHLPQEFPASPHRMKTRHLLVLLALLCSVFPARAQLELRAGAFNSISTAGAPTGSGPPTVTPQFAGVGATTSGSAAISTSSTLSQRHPFGNYLDGAGEPTGQGFVLLRSRVGYSVASGVPRYLLGDVIERPLTKADGVTPAPDNYWRIDPVRPGEVINHLSDIPQTETPIAAGAPESAYYSRHAKRVFASQPGSVSIKWVTRVPEADGRYKFRDETFSVSAVTRNPVRPMYWTERSFTAPTVSIPNGRITAVNPVFNNYFPAAAAAEYVAPGTVPNPNGLPEELRTFWMDSAGGNKSLHAYNREGRILVEYLGAALPDGLTNEFLGADVIEVTRVAKATQVTTQLGEPILPQDADPALTASPILTGGLNPYYGSTTRPDGTVIYYAERENLDPDRVQFYWLETQDAAIYQTAAPQLSIKWPKYQNKYAFVWPDDLDDFAHITVPAGGSTTGTGVFFGGGGVPQIVFQDDGSLTEASIDLTTQTMIVNPADGLNRSLIKFINGTEFWYVRLYTQDETRAGFQESDGLPPINTIARVGERIERPSAAYEIGGYIAGGTGYQPSAYRNPYATGVPGASSGAIIPVNAVPGNNQLTVWWFRKVAAPNANFQSFFVASKVARYNVSYPSNPDKIVLASNAGSGELGPSESAGALYVQNDRTQPGFNPNEEHAMLLAGRAYALRDDLNITEPNAATYTSQPFVLLAYTNPGDNRPAMRAFQVLREDATHDFDYPVTAGTILQGPMPLPLLPLPVDANGTVRNVEVTPANIDPRPDPTAPALYDSFTFEDRKGFHWVYRGPHAVGNPALRFQFYYPMQEGFFIPGLSAQPAAGTVLPYLRPLDLGVPQGDPVAGTPLTILYRPQWPTAPELRVAETLTLPKFGLPTVRGQASAEVLYQQSIAQLGAERPSTTLHDSTRDKTVRMDAPNVGLAALPASAATAGSLGKIYFQLLPPHLQERFYYDPLLGPQGKIGPDGKPGPKGSLVLRGEFVDEIAGEDYLQLNVLSGEDVATLKGIVPAGADGKDAWNEAIDGLNTRLETFIEDPARRGTYIVNPAQNRDIGENDIANITDSDTAVDSYALTATGQGAGYVTLLFGDGEAFTPEGEPVAMKIIKVTPQLYTGDLKVLTSRNPLDEKVTLRHSGDFAAKSEDYEFEWRYTPPLGGVAPPVYTFALQTLLGDATAGNHLWRPVQNPGAALATPAQYAAAAAVPLPRSVVIRDSAYNAAGGFPGLVIKSETGVDFTSGLPAQLFFSADLAELHGFVLYVNGIAALANNAPGFPSTDATTGLSASGLAKQFSVSPNFFAAGDNTIEIALFTTADAGTAATINFRLEGSQESDQVVGAGTPWIAPGGTLGNLAVLGGSPSAPLGSPLLVMTDNYFTMRYRAKPGTNSVAGTNWSRWMPPKLVEGWIKRVLAGINPFNQRITDLLNNPVNTDVSLLTQAGKRWEGDVALTLENINDFGLIEIYETVLGRGKNLSIDSGYDYGPANDALLLAAGYLNDLYVILGNEAFADGANPTISLDDQTTITEVNTSRFSFEGQVSSVLDEELGLLRGRDDFLAPGVNVSPGYNRLYWNYTRGINSGEALYAVNYNIKEKAGSPTANGVLNAADAQRMFPQGHGDAYGHYLTAIKGYYRLLSNPNFTWVPRTEAVTVLGQAVQVDYFDERKFAAAAGRIATTAQQILALTHRKLYKDDPAAGWSHYRDGQMNSQTGTTRRWGLDEWTARSAQGSYFNWVMGNALLPESDTDPQHTGIQIIDRTTVPELTELASMATTFQTIIDNASSHLNPLGLSSHAIAFDISPSQLTAGNSHYEQIYDRALRSVLNARGAFDQAAKMTRLLRNQENQIDDYNAAIVDQEGSFVTQLTEIFGSPYLGDIGPGKTYAQDYQGPDLVSWFVIDRPTDMVDTTAPKTITVNVPVNVKGFTGNSIDDVRNALTNQTAVKTFTVQPNRFVQYSDTYRAGLGQREVTGRLQQALLDAHQAQLALIEAGGNVDSLRERFRREHMRFNEMLATHTKTLALKAATSSKVQELEQTIAQLNTAAGFLAQGGAFASSLGDAINSAIPEVFGLANDIGRPAAGAAKLAGTLAAFGLNLAAEAERSKATLQGPKITVALNQLEANLDALGFTQDQRQAIYEYELLFNELTSQYFIIADLATNYQRANQQVGNVLAEGTSVLADRESFRQRAAAIVQGYRTRDLSFRTFRNEALEQYRSLFDLAGRYTYLAAKSYDYETGLLGSNTGRAVLSGIVASRSLGDLTGDMPQATTSTLGDSGLAGTMARLQADWTVAEGRLGINNPDQNGTLFSLRGELFRITDDPAVTTDDDQWQQTIQQHIARNVLEDPDVARYCRNLRKADGSAVPGIVIPFSSTIEHGDNFFGLPLAGGDHAYTPSNFATKIFSVGMVLPGYVGMDTFASGSQTAGAPTGGANTLSATPYVYLIPVGTDAMLAPALGDTGVMRTWTVHDQALPLPFNLGATDFSTTQFFSADGTLTEQPWILRKHQAFRPVSDATLFYGSMPQEFTSSRLIGRSAWNTRWKIVIPAYTLLNNEKEGLNRFAATVDDIQLFLRTYSNSGN